MIQQTSFLGISLRNRSRRCALVIAYYAVLILLLLISFHFLRFAAVFLVAQTFTLGSLMGGLQVEGPVKPYGHSDKPREIFDGSGIQQLNLSQRRPFAFIKPLDEREKQERDRAHFVAYRILLVSLGMFLLVIISLVDMAPAFLSRNVVAIVWFLVVYVVSLPQSVILWTEPAALQEGDLRLVVQEPR